MTPITTKRTRKTKPVAADAATNNNAQTEQQQANQALLDSIRRIGTGKHLVGDAVCIIHATLGVDTMPIGSAPGGECVRIYVYTDNPDALSFEALAASLGIPKPLSKSAMDFVSILKHRTQSGEVLGLVPSHASSLNVSSHSRPPVVPSAIVSQPPAIGQYWPEQGGIYIGIASDVTGGVPGHLVLLNDKPTKHLTWDAARKWAKTLGKDARLPTRVEALLIFANAKNRIESTYHWTNEEHNASYAWYCDFRNGNQLINHESFEGSAVAVRRLVIQFFNSLGGVAA